jgi:hypothetical protein
MPGECGIQCCPRWPFALLIWRQYMALSQRGMAVNAVSPDSFSIAKYMIQGVVQDDQGLPVEGAALHVGKEVVYTDSSGRFQARFSKHGPTR